MMIPTSGLLFCFAELAAMRPTSLSRAAGIEKYNDCAG